MRLDKHSGPDIHLCRAIRRHGGGFDRPSIRAVWATKWLG